MSLGKLLLNIGVNTGTFETDMGRAARVSAKRSKQIKKDIDVAMKAVVTGFTAAASASLLMVKSTANIGDKLDKMSKRLGVSVEFLSRYDHQASLTGTSLESVDKGVTKLQKSINDSINGLSTATRGFDALGLSAQELSNLNPEQAFELVADKLGKLEKQSELTGTAMDLLGRSGTELINLFKQTPEQVAKANEELERFGAVMSTAQAEQGAAFNDALQSLSKNAEGFSNVLSSQLTPALTEIINQFNDSTIRSTATEDFTILQNSIIGVFSVALHLKAGFESIGTALGQIAAKSIDSFKLLATGFETFIKRIHRGSAIIASGFSDDADETQRRLGLEIQGLEEEFTSLYEKISTAPDTTIFEDIDKIFGKVQTRVNNLSTAIENGNKELAKSKKPASIAENSMIAFGDAVKYTEAELNKLSKDFESIADRFLTPLEKLQNQFDAEIVAIDDWLSAQENFDQAVILAANLTNELTKEFDNNVKALEDNQKALGSQLSPYDDLIQSMKNELELLSLKGTELTRAIAVQDLARLGITESIVGQDEYNQKLTEYLGLIQQLEQANNTPSFNQKLDGISGMISSLDNMHNAFKTMGRNFGKGMQALASGFQGALSGLGELLSKDLLGGKLGNLLGGIGVVGQIASFVDAIAGGRLFGTDFEQESASTNINIGASGASGTQTVTSVRQRSFFRGREWQTITENIEQAGLNALNAFYNGLIGGIDDLSRSFGIDVPNLITGAFEQNFDENGDLVSQFSDIMGRIWNETQEQFLLRLASENYIAVGDLGLGGGNEISNFAERFRSSAESLSEFADFAINAVSRIQSGDGLLGSFTAIASVVEELSYSNETLLETHNRIIGSVDLLNNSLDTMGIALFTNEEHFLRFATSITEAAGGLEQAQSLWNSYFNTFYDANELINTQLSGATAIRDSLIGGLGVQGLGIDNFRDMFENVLPTLSADAIVQWLEAAEAIGLVIDLESQLTDQRQELTSILDNINEAMATDGLSDFALAMRAIQNNLDEQIATAIRLGATEKELDMIRTFATRQITNAIREYEQIAQQLSNDIFGTVSENLITGIESQLNSVGEQISLLEQQQSAAQQAAQAAIQAYEAQQAALENIVDFAESLLTGQFSPLNPAEQLAIAQSQFNQALSAAQGGDLGALGNLQGLANTLLGLSQTNFASGQANTDIFNSVYDALSGLGIGLGQGAPSATVGVPAGLSALYEQQAQLNQQLADAQQAANENTTLLQQQQLFQMLAELSAAQDLTIEQLANNLGIPIYDLIDDLGFNLRSISVALQPLNSPDIGNNDTERVVDSIINEGSETQEEIRNLRNDVQELSSEIRSLAAQAAA